MFIVDSVAVTKFLSVLSLKRGGVVTILESFVDGYLTLLFWWGYMLRKMFSSCQLGSKESQERVRVLIFSPSHTYSGLATLN